MKNKIKIINFTDPVCTWCYGMEPVFRKLETHFPEQIEFRFIMGGLVEHVDNMRDVRNGIGSEDVEEFNKQVAGHWLHASKRHGMPVDSENFHLFSKEFPSTYPQNIAYKAAQMADSEKADLFLYNLRVAAAAEARIISKEEVLVEIAKETEIDSEKFLHYFRNGEAEKAFYSDMEYMRTVGVHSFPTFLLEIEGKEYLLNGYADYDFFKKVIEEKTEGRMLETPPKVTEEGLLAFWEKHPRMAEEEVKQAFEWKERMDVRELISRLLEEGKLKLVRKGNGIFLER